MSTTFSVPDVEQELTRFGIADAAIAKMAEDYLPLTINGLSDRAGYDRVHSARMIVRSKRTKIEGVRKELKADALEYGRKVDAEAKRLTALIEPIENHLIEQESAIDRERERIKNAEIEAARQKAEAEELARRQAGEARIAAERAAKEEELRIERERLAAERAEMEAERKRLADEQAARQRLIDEENARIAAAQKAESDRLAEIARIQREAQEKIDAENRRVKEEAEAKARAEETARIQKEAAERARVETEARLKREAAEAESQRVETERKAKLKAERAEAAKPDVQKIKCLAELFRGITFPTVKGPDAIEFIESIREAVEGLALSCEQYEAAV